MEFRTKNPVLNGIEEKVERVNAYETGRTASFSGIATKTGILLLIIFGISAYIWANLNTLTPYLGLLLFGGMIVGFISVIVAGFSKTAAPVFTVIYAIAEGAVLGALTGVINSIPGYQGIVSNAAVITFAIFAFLLIAYATGIFKVGLGFRKFVFTATLGAAIFILFQLFLQIFHIYLWSGISSGLLIVVTVAMILLASFNLLIDFDNCKMAVNMGISSRDEWYLSLGLLVTIIWLYIEVLRLLLILTRRN